MWIHSTTKAKSSAWDIFFPTAAKMSRLLIEVLQIVLSSSLVLIILVHDMFNHHPCGYILRPKLCRVHGIFSLQRRLDVK